MKEQKKILFPRRIREPALMQAHEDRVYGEAAKERSVVWFTPIVDDIIQKTGQVGGTILDVACGPGLLSKAFGNRSKRFFVTGIDLSRSAVSIARKNCKGIPNVRIQSANALALPFKDETMDVVVCRDSLHHFPRPESALQEMVRVLKKGGLLYIQDLRRDMPERLIRMAAPRKTIFQKLQWYSARAAYTKKEMEDVLRTLPLSDKNVSTRKVTRVLQKKIARYRIPQAVLRNSFQAHYVAVGYKQ